MATNKRFSVRHGLQINGDLEAGGSTGTSGQVLSSTGTGVQWITPSGGGGGSIDGSGSANKLSIWSDADTLTFDTNLHWDTTNDRLGVGTATPRAGIESIQTSTTAGLGLSRAVSSSAASTFIVRKSRGTEASPTIVSEGDGAGTITFAVYDGVSYINGANINSYVFAGGTPGEANVPTGIRLRGGVGEGTSSAGAVDVRPDGRVVIGTPPLTFPSSALTIQDSFWGTHLTMRYDGSNYCNASVSSTGVTTFDTVGTGAKFVFSDAVEVPDSAYGSGWDGSTAVPTRNAVYDRLEQMKTESFIIAASDEITSITAGTNKVKFRMPYAFTVTAVRASLSTAQTSGNIFTVDINESGTSILSTKLTIDNTETTSTTAATAPVISDTALADDSEISVDVDQIGDGTAKGLKITIIGFRP